MLPDERTGAPKPGSVGAQFETLLATCRPDIAVTARALRQVVADAVPTATQSVDLPDRLLAFATGPKLRDMLFAIIPHAAHVNLQLADGADLPNPDGLIEGTGKRVRHVKVRTADAARSGAVRAVIDAEIAYRRG